MTATTRFLDVLHGRQPDTTPVWIMRQAGRYLPEYRELRARHEFLELCRIPELAAEVTLQPLRRFPLDAAILFSDILIPLAGMGQALAFHEGEGPRLEPVRSEADLAALDPGRVPEANAFVPAAIRLLKGELAGRTPLIGFAGAPFTLACYAVEGGGSHNFRWVKGMMFQRPELFHRLMDTITRALEHYIGLQLAAGIDAFQLFDTWGGVLARPHYEAFALPYAKRLLAAVGAAGVPAVYFVLDGAHLLDLAAGAGAPALGVDWRTPLARVREHVGPDLVLQGNLDPAALYGTPAALRRETAAVIAGAGERHVFNLGHGVWPDAPVDAVARLVDLVHELGRRGER